MKDFISNKLPDEDTAGPMSQITLCSENLVDKPWIIEWVCLDLGLWFHYLLSGEHWVTYINALSFKELSL